MTRGHGRRSATSSAIAFDLGLCGKTVEGQRAHVMRTMEAGSFAELVRGTRAARLG
jgi:FixJ family two-component response regulator